MGLGKQERRGIVILVFVTLAITSLGFVMRYCGRPGDAASQVVPVQTVIYRPAADDAGEDENYERGSRHKKKSARKQTGKETESKVGASDGPRRDFLRDSIPVSRDYR